VCEKVKAEKLQGRKDVVKSRKTHISGFTQVQQHCREVRAKGF